MSTTRTGYDIRKVPKSSGFARPKVLNTKKIKINALPGHDITNQDVIVLGYRSSAHELLRFGSEPIMLGCSLWEKNKDKSTAERDKDSYKALDKTLTQFTGTSESGRLAYINPMCVAQTFFSSAKTKINNVDLGASLPQQGHLDALYTSLQKYFMPGGTRQEKYGIDTCITGSWDENEDGAKLKELCGQLNFDVTNSTKPGLEYSVFRCHYDGVPYLCVPRNYQLVSLIPGFDQSSNSFVVLPPNTEILFIFNKKNPKYAGLEQVMNLDGSGTAQKIEKSTLFSGKKQNTALEDYELRLEFMYIEAEVSTLDMSETINKRFLKKLEQEDVSQVFDVHNTTTVQVPPTQNSSTLSFDLAPGCNLAYFSFGYKDNLYFNKSSQHYNTAYSRWPTEVDKVRLFVGMEEILWSGGLAMHDRADVERYYQYLRERGWMDEGNKKYFADSDVAYWSALALDLSMFDNSKGKELRVEITFRQPSPEGLYAVLTRVESKALVQKQEGGKTVWSVAPFEV